MKQIVRKIYKVTLMVIACLSFILMCAETTDGGMADYNAMATVATKGYFHLIGETPLALDEGESVSFRGGFALGKVPTTS